MRKNGLLCLCFAALLVVLPACASPVKKRNISKTGYTLDDVCDLAKNEAEVATSDYIFLWQLEGLALPIIGTIIGCIALPEIPPGRLEYKNVKYIEEYKRCFNDKARERRFAQTMYYTQYLLILGGIIGGFLLYGVIVSN